MNIIVAHRRRAPRLPFVGLVGLLLSIGSARASSSGGSSLPWETPLQSVVTSISGPVAFGISVIGIVVSGGMLIWGGELGEFARRIVMLVLVLALIVGGTNLLTTLFSSAATF